MSKNGAFFWVAAVVLFASLGYPQAFAKDAQSYLDSAQTYVQKGNLKAAEIELRNAVREAPKDAHIHALLAQVHLALGDFRSAEREARSARDLNGNETDYLLTLADAMMRQGKLADIAEQIKAANRPPEFESKVRLALAMAAAQGGDRAKSEGLLRESIALDQDAPGPKIVLVRQLLGSNIDEAEKLSDEILAKNPRSAEAIALRGEALRMRGDVEGAMRRFDEALVIDSNNSSARLSRASVNFSRGDYDGMDKDLDAVIKVSPKNFQANYLQALKHFKKRDFDAADQILEQLSPAFASMPDGYYVLAATKYGRGQYAQASDAIAKYVARVPGNRLGARLAAMIAMRRGARDVAVQYLTDYLSKSTPDPATLTLLGEAYNAVGKPDLALEQYQKAAALEPENLSLKTRVAESQINLGTGKGLDELEQVVATEAGAAIAGPTLVLSELRAGRIEKAAEVAEQLVKRDGDNQSFQNLLGIVRVAQRNYSAAEMIFKALVDKRPDFAPARKNLANIYVLSGKKEEAKNTYRDFLMRKPNDVSALLGLADIGAGERRWDEAIGYVEQARKASPSDPAPGIKLLEISGARQDWDRAKSLASQLSTQFPSNAAVFDLRGRVLAASGDRDGAINAYKRAYEIDSNSAQTLSHYLSSLAAAKRFPEYREVLQSRLVKDPGNKSLKAQLVTIEAEISGLEAGLAKAQRFSNEDPNTSLYDLASADLYERAGRRAEALALLEKTTKARPTDDAVTVGLSRLYIRNGNSAKAEAVLSSVLKDRPDAVTIRSALSQVYINDKKFAAAIGELTRVLADRPNDTEALNNLAWLYQQQGDLFKARELAETAVRIAPTNGAIADTLGWILLAQGDTENALRHLQAASTALPENLEIRYHVAAALGRAGRTADARAMLEQLLNSGGRFTSKAEAEKLLEELKRG